MIQSCLGQIDFRRRWQITLRLHGNELLQPTHEFLHSLRGRRRNGKHTRMSGCLLKILQKLFFLFFHFGDVQFVEDDDLRLLGQVLIVLLQFIVDGMEVAQRIFGCSVDDVQQDLASLHVAQKCLSQPSPAGGTFDQSWNIAQHETSPFRSKIANSQVGNDRREWVVGNFGPCGRCGCQQRALAGVRFSQESHVGDETEFHRQPSLGTGFTAFRQFR
mmetsp:Transcript_21995/g.62644  ORF Transcript_21995/g.62644 Transcript_21995/m.62644 type:complete len:217 (+) Transcript_21995:546-1196(+)